MEGRRVKRIKSKRASQKRVEARTPPTWRCQTYPTPSMYEMTGKSFSKRAIMGQNAKRDQNARHGKKAKHKQKG